ncbi:MAG: hypothetical protein CL844_08820 [Crocinitomicaceae bacterium]|nr:hypothetical protein [Crocinitomicaceae bacterium]|tara:strand:+ start:31255 stop:31647 length:393 start_codon:yes stop_codon:yes gene_type:complete
MNYKLGKNYKLCSKAIIKSLFETGITIKHYPFIATFKEINLTLPPPLKVTFSAPKRIFKKAHRRNKIKRKTKEAFRLNKNIIEHYLIEKNKQIALFLVYSTQEEFSHIVLEEKTKKLFDKIINKLEENHD